MKLQRKVAISEPDDAYEREANRVADAVLAHELTHTTQQGTSQPLAAGTSAALDPSLPVGQHGARDSEAPHVGRAGAPMVQRLGNEKERPADLSCPVPTSSPGSAGTSIMFGQDRTTLTAAERTTLSAIAAAWHAGGGAGVLRIDGYASVEGPDAYNWQVSCLRALNVAEEIAAPKDNSPGVPATKLEWFAHGETDEFSPTSLAPNRGPDDEVNHLCANAYPQPNDNLTCGTFPAPPLTLTATGAAAGATPRWSIIRGGIFASIAGPTIGASVNIQGDAASAAQGDVTVQMTDGTCTATHLVTVREPSSMTAAQAPSVSPTRVTNVITYTARDQFGNPMGADICGDETITICADSHPSQLTFRDAATDINGEVRDGLTMFDSAGFLSTPVRRPTRS